LHTSLFTSESVSRGHPDKVADQISDAVLDSLLQEDPHVRSAVETMVATGWIAVVGEWGSGTVKELRLEELIRGVVRDIGYRSAEVGMDADDCSLMMRLVPQSDDIWGGGGGGGELADATDGVGGVRGGGAGDQGMMFGYAANETRELMPSPIQLAHRLMRELDDARVAGRVPWLRPDGKGQVTVEYVDGKPQAVAAVVLSAQHDPDTGQREVREALEHEVIRRAIPEHLLEHGPKLHLNPTGRFVTGGPAGDAGLTGRKIIVDTYGGMARHGGGAFSGKDPTKVDRSAAYAARWAAKNVVAAGLAERCEIQLAYAIGVVDPVSIRIDTFGTANHGLTDATIAEAVKNVFDFTPRGIIRELSLQRPIYRPTAVYGHFGREPASLGEGHFPWERIDRVDLLQDRLDG